MSDTPRTDNCIDIADDEGIEDVKFCEVIANFARQLERELAGAQAEIERLREYTTCTLESTDAEMDDKDIQIIKKDKLIEQLKKALESAKQRHYVNDDDNWYSCPASGLCSDDHAGTDCNCGADHANSIIEAALSAAERR